MVISDAGTHYQYPFTPKSLIINGQRLSYVDEGAGRIVVMLHGNPTWSYMYRHLISALSREYRVIAPDHIGCGLSAKPAKYRYQLSDHIDNLEILLERLGVRKCVVVVHDWGGAIGMGWAGRHPEKIAGLVVFNTAAFRSRRIPWRIALCRVPLLGAILVRGFNLFAKGAISMAVVNKMDPQVAAEFLQPYDSWAHRIAVHRFVRDIPLGKRHPSWAELVRIEKGLNRLQNKPMLICWGGRDFCFDKTFYTEWHQRFPGAEAHYFNNAGHYLLEDAFGEIVPLVEKFLHARVW